MVPVVVGEAHKASAHFGHNSLPEELQRQDQGQSQEQIERHLSYTKEGGLLGCGPETRRLSPRCK